MHKNIFWNLCGAKEKELQNYTHVVPLCKDIHNKLAAIKKVPNTQLSPEHSLIHSSIFGFSKYQYENT